MSDDVLLSPGHLISLAARSYAKLSEARLKPLGFGVGHLPVLVALHSGKANTQRELAKFARIEQPPMAQMLTRMERDGLITRSPNPADGRSSYITLTNKAKQRLPQAIAVLMAGNEEVMTGLSSDERRQFIGTLSKLIANLDKLLSDDN
ncbi:Transcriptional regulator SlyA [Thalassocella blandensis]|nr:Transcriptional regulator SlyA [Thalassocella blandensis]